MKSMPRPWSLLVAVGLTAPAWSSSDELRFSSGPAALRSDGQDVLPRAHLKTVAVRAAVSFESLAGGYGMSASEDALFRAAVAQEAANVGLSVLPPGPAAAGQAMLGAGIAVREGEQRIEYEIELDLLLPAAFADGARERVLVPAWQTRGAATADPQQWPEAGLAATRRAVRAF